MSSSRAEHGTGTFKVVLMGPSAVSISTGRSAVKMASWSFLGRSFLATRSKLAPVSTIPFEFGDLSLMLCDLPLSREANPRGRGKPGGEGAGVQRRREGGRKEGRGRRRTRKKVTRTTTRSSRRGLEEEVGEDEERGRQRWKMEVSEVR